MEGNQAAMDEDAVSLPDSVVSEKEGNSDTEQGSDAPSLPPSVEIHCLIAPAKRNFVAREVTARQNSRKMS